MHMISSMNRRDFLRCVGAGAATAAVTGCARPLGRLQAKKPADRPSMLKQESTRPEIRSKHEWPKSYIRNAAAGRLERFRDSESTHLRPEKCRILGGCCQLTSA